MYKRFSSMNLLTKEDIEIDGFWLDINAGLSRTGTHEKLFGPGVEPLSLTMQSRQVPSLPPTVIVSSSEKQNDEIFKTDPGGNNRASLQVRESLYRPKG